MNEEGNEHRPIGTSYYPPYDEYQIVELHATDRGTLSDLPGQKMLAKPS
jgi:hypothetical protein